MDRPVQAETISIRARLKDWETSFLRDHGRAATREDARSQPDIYLLYKQYGASKNPPNKRRVEPPSTPSKTKADKASATDVIGDGEDEEPEKDEQQVIMVKATPSHGRVLGLFEAVLPGSESPSKSYGLAQNMLATPSRKNNHAYGEAMRKQPAISVAPALRFGGGPDKGKALGTPQTHRTLEADAETPEVARTPAYLHQRGSFLAESPAYPRKSLQYMASQVYDEASLLANNSDDDDGCSNRGEDSAGSDSDRFIGELHDEHAEETYNENGLAIPLQSRRRRRGGASRSGRRGGRTRAVVLRPVLETDKVSKRAATENYQRLNIAPKKPFRR